MRMVKLTGLSNPDIDGGAASPVFVDADRVVYIERSSCSFLQAGKHESYRQAVDALYDEVQRVSGLVGRIRFDPENHETHGSFVDMRSAAEDLRVAYGMVAAIKGPFEHPRFTCTTIGLAYGNDSGSGALARFHVMETVEEVARALSQVA